MNSTPCAARGAANARMQITTAIACDDTPRFGFITAPSYARLGGTVRRKPPDSSRSFATVRDVPICISVEDLSRNGTRHLQFTRDPPSRLPRRRGPRRGPHAVPGLVRLAAWSPGIVASIAANRRRPAAAVAVSHVRRVGQGPRLSLQRPVLRDPWREASCRPREAFLRYLVGDLAGHQPADRCRNGRRGHLSRGPSARHEPQGIRRADMVHVFLFAGAGRERQSRRDVLCLLGDDCRRCWRSVRCARAKGVSARSSRRVRTRFTG